ncbi:hypothetical protein GCM10009836_60340 [Pseudonocardia ailaonensis]|uniref:ABC transporter permease n=1 Tax=Pseudonocardia ailaonensis TaxID=367279 RepID=A0ABN2NJ33_9PSEU
MKGGVRRFASVAGVVLLHAAVQMLLVIGDPSPGATLWFVLAAIASVVALVLAVWAVARLVGGRAVAGGVGLGRVVVVGVLAVAASLLSPLALPVVLVLGTPWLVGARPSGRAVLLLVGGLVLAALSWVIAMVLGFFVGGLVAAFLTWVWFGAVAALLLRGFARLR